MTQSLSLVSLHWRTGSLSVVVSEGLEAEFSQWLRRSHGIKPGSRSEEGLGLS